MDVNRIEGLRIVMKLFVGVDPQYVWSAPTIGDCKALAFQGCSTCYADEKSG